MSTTSKCCSTAHIAAITGVVVLAGIAAFAWAMFSRRKVNDPDPLTETDQRIDALEDSLHRLQDTFRQAVGV